MEIRNILTSLKGIGTNFPGEKIVEGHEVGFIVVIQHGGRMANFNCERKKYEVDPEFQSKKCFMIMPTYDKPTRSNSYK